jgi:hypothetical protein
MRKTLIVAACAALVSCGNKDDSTPASTNDTGSSTAAATFTCGPGPYADGQLRLKDPDNLRNLDAVTLTSPQCPGASAKTDEDGLYYLKLTKGMNVTGRLVKPGYITTITSEFKFADSGLDLQSYLLPDAKKSLLPEFSAANGYIVIAVFYDPPVGDAGATLCQKTDGVSFAVKGKTGVKATYLTALTPLAVDPMLTATTSVGVGILGPLPPGTYEVEATKMGCTFTPEKSATVEFTGKMIVEGGAATYHGVHSK